MSYREARAQYIQAEMAHNKTRTYVLRGEGAAVIGAFLWTLTRYCLHQRLTDISAWLPAIIALATPFLYYVFAYLSYRLRAPRKLYESAEAALADTKMALARTDRSLRRAFTETEVAMFASEHSRKTPKQRADTLEALYTPRRDAIMRGDFSRANEIIPIAQAYLRTLNEIVPLGSVAYDNAEKEIRKIFDIAQRHILNN